ncbi:MAG TPA: phosphate signaling complex protein PhoU [Allocoleopsis sp.]
MERATEVSLSSTTSNSERSHFDRCLRRLEQDVLRMGALVENSFRLSHQAMFSQNLEAAKAITALDDQIDRYYRNIELECATLMTLEAPVAQDLRLLSAFMQLVRDLERIGDYAEDLAEIALKLLPYPSHPCLPQIELMSHHAQAMLATSLVALADLDATAGQAVKELDDKVDTAYDTLYQTLAYQRDIKGVVEPILLLVLAIRHLERMADHATNIGQRVSYIVTGHHH